MIISSRFRSVTTAFRFINVWPLLRRESHSKNQKKNPCTGKPKPMVDFNCKIALITGGSEGIGMATAHELLSEKIQGVALVGTDTVDGRDAVNFLNCTYGKNKAIFVHCDMKSEAKICECYQKVIKEFGKLDIVVTTDCIFDGVDWEKEINRNLMGTIRNVYSAFKIMSKECCGQGGVILTISGLHAIKPMPPGPTYSASLFGILGFSRSIGDLRNFHKTGIRIVSLCPGFTNTKTLKKMSEKTYNGDMSKQLEILLCKGKRQSADVCGKSAVYVLKYGNTGSVWVVNGSKLYSLNIPKWKKYRVLESQLI